MIIGIIHHNSNKQFLKPLLKSLKGVKYPVQIIYNNASASNSDEIDCQDVVERIVYNLSGGYELGALKALVNANPKEKDFFLIHNSTLIKDKQIFDIADSVDGTFVMSGGIMSYMAKYRREILETIGIPVPKTKEVAIYYEYFWNIIYMNTEKKIAMCDQPLVDSKVFENKYGRRNMVIENDYLKKWKANWKGFQILQASDYIPK